MLASLSDRIGARWRRNDEGMTLVEVMTACVVLAILSVSVFGVLSTTLKTTRTDKARVAAANLASRELEAIRDYFRSSNDAVNNVLAQVNVPQDNPTPLPGGTAGQPLVVDGIPFDVKRTVFMQLVGPGASACDGGSSVLHPSYAVHVEVTWPRMSAAPVTADTVLTPPKGVVTSSTSDYGFLAVKLVNSGGLPVSGISVNFAGPQSQTAVTDPAGCAVASFTKFGTFTATPAAPAGISYVSDDGNPTPSVSGSVSTGTLTKRSLTYDKAATLSVTLAAPTGYALPSTLPMITLGNSGLQPKGVRSFAAAAPTTTLPSLWPSSDGYTAWAGSCADADPAAPPASASRGVPLNPAPGGSASVTITLQPVDVTVQGGDGTLWGNVAVTATNADPTTCAGSDSTLTLGSTDKSGHLLTTLPYGNWILNADGGTSAVTMDGSTNTAAVVLP